MLGYTDSRFHKQNKLLKRQNRKNQKRPWCDRKLSITSLTSNFQLNPQNTQDEGEMEQVRDGGLFPAFLCDDWMFCMAVQDAKTPNR